MHARIADRRRDFLHQLSTRLIRENQVVCVESLAVKNMVKNGNLAKSISDVGWSEFVSLLSYKAEWYGRTVVKIDRWYPSSKRCFECGHILDSLTLDIRNWTCPECGVSHDRDINAAKNMLAAGLAVSACRGCGRVRKTRRGENQTGQDSKKQETLEAILGIPRLLSGGGCQRENLAGKAMV
jgi:putative transposase